MLASLFTAGFYVVGHLTRDLRELGLQSGVGSLEWVTRGLYWVLPDLESFNLTIEAVHGLPISPSEFWLPIAYAAGMTGVLLVAAALVFERRDFRWPYEHGVCLYLRGFGCKSFSSKDLGRSAGLWAPTFQRNQLRFSTVKLRWI